jgi:integrase
MRRGSELAALRVEDVTIDGERACVRVRKAKNDQLGRGHEVFIDASGSAACPVRLLKEWLRVRGTRPGLLFTACGGRPLSTSTISAVCQRMVAAAGRSEVVTSHSLRIGGATAAVEGGLTREQAMTIGGWESDAVDRYLRARELAAEGVSHRMGF